jgi:hypothetical protein
VLIEPAARALVTPYLHEVHHHVKLVVRLEGVANVHLRRRPAASVYTYSSRAHS